MNTKRIDPDPVGSFLGILGVLGSFLSIGVAVESRSKESRRELQQIEDSTKVQIEEIRRDLRNLSDYFEDLLSLMQSVAEDSGNEYFNDQFKAGSFLLLLHDEMKQYVRIKGSLDQSICQITIKLNGILRRVVNHNPSAANVFIEFTDEVQKCLNSILLEGGSYKDASKNIESTIDLISIHLRKVKGNK